MGCEPYLGRPPRLVYLDSDTLEVLYWGFRRDVSHAAAVNFVRFVNGLRDLSPAAFRHALKRFWDGDCKDVRIEQFAIDRCTPFDGEPMSLGGAILLLGSILFPNEMSEDQICANSIRKKADFIGRHIGEIPVRERHNDWLLAS